ncbi:hypothetical protein BGX24_011454 [Mortierella sp. AD032]|nr:hypothetical protein BGX24_011454 [Mortierella sp. AD032]
MTEAHLLSSSASTTPTIPCSDVFSGSENNNNKAYVAGDKPGVETEWNQDVKDDMRALKMKKDTSQDQDNDLTPPAYKKDKQKDLDSCNDNDDDESVYQSEQEFGHFSTATPFFDPSSEEYSWREYRNMMYYSTNYPPPYSTGGGESTNANLKTKSTTTEQDDLVEKDLSIPIAFKFIIAIDKFTLTLRLSFYTFFSIHVNLEHLDAVIGAIRKSNHYV